MSRDDEGSYDDRHRTFLQAFISRSTLTPKEAKPILAAIWSAHERRVVPPEAVRDDDFYDYVNSINNAISPYDMEIRSTFHQHSRERVYALINSTSDPVTQLATNYTPDEIAFLKRVLDTMFDTNNTMRHEVMAITSMEAVRLHKPSTNRRHTQNGTETQGSTGQGITMVQAEKMLKSLVAQGWFEQSRRGYFTLTPRALMELRGWLLDTYNDDPEDDEEEEERNPKIKLCFACREIVTVGQRCPQRACPCRLHDICIENFFTVQRNRQCPVCQTEWTGLDFVGERAAASASNRRSTGAAPIEPSEPSPVQADEPTRTSIMEDDLYD